MWFEESSLPFGRPTHISPARCPRSANAKLAPLYFVNSEWVREWCSERRASSGSGAFCSLSGLGYGLATCTPVEGGPDSVYYEWLAETLRSMMPRAILLGLATPEEFKLDSLAAEIREEALRYGAPMNAAILTGVWAKTGN